jgi:hypothetical protein
LKKISISGIGFLLAKLNELQLGGNPYLSAITGCNAFASEEIMVSTA